MIEEQHMEQIIKLEVLKQFVVQLMTGMMECIQCHWLTALNKVKQLVGAVPGLDVPDVSSLPSSLSSSSHCRKAKHFQDPCSCREAGTVTKIHDTSYAPPDLNMYVLHTGEETSICTPGFGGLRPHSTNV